MSKFLDALKKKFRTPRDVMLALGLDASLLDEDEDDPKKKVVIAHDEAVFAAPTPNNRRTPMNIAERKLLNAMRARFKTVAEPLRRLGMDQSDLDNASGEPDDSDAGGDLGALLAQFRQLTDEDKSAFLQAITKMADENDETAGDRERRRYAQDHGSGQPVSSFASRYPHAARIRNM